MQASLRLLTGGSSRRCVCSSGRSTPTQPRRVAAVRNGGRQQTCVARAAAKDVASLKSLKTKVNYAAADPVYVLASEYLSQIGLLNLAERSRVLDIATNPSSLFLGRGRNASARPLSVDGDMRPVVEFLGARGVKSAELVQIIIGYPAVLGTAVPKLQAFWDYLESIGVTDVGSVIITRPNLLGLDVDANLRKIVDYLLYVETPVETIVKYIEKSI